MTTAQLQLPFMMTDPYQRAVTIMQEQFDKNRKALFAKCSEIKKENEEIKYRLSMWEKAICQRSVGIEIKEEACIG